MIRFLAVYLNGTPFLLIEGNFSVKPRECFILQLKEFVNLQSLCVHGKKNLKDQKSTYNSNLKEGFVKWRYSSTTLHHIAPTKTIRELCCTCMGMQFLLHFLLQRGIKRREFKFIQISFTSDSKGTQTPRTSPILLMISRRKNNFRGILRQ